MSLPLEIKRWPDRSLVQPCFPVPPSLIGTREIQSLIDSMASYVDMRCYEIGGIAANQVGSSNKIIVLDLDYRPREVINPECVFVSTETSLRWESCLSLPEWFKFPVKRHDAVVVRGLDRSGKEFTLSLADEEAVLAQHEIDHVNGILITSPWWRRARFLAKMSNSYAVVPRQTIVQGL